MRDVKLYSLLDALLHKGRAGCVLEYILWFYLLWVCRERFSYSMLTVYEHAAFISASHCI